MKIGSSHSNIAPTRLATLVQAATYAGVGVVNTLVDIVAYMLLVTAGLAPLAANVISFGLGAVNSLVLNKYVTFRDAPMRFSRQLVIRFSAVTLLSLGISQLSLFLLIEAGLSEFAAKLVSVVFTFAVSFGANKYLTFRP